MKYKKTIFLIITFLTIYIIYFCNQNKSLTYLALGDSFAVGENAYGEQSYGYTDYLANYLSRNYDLKLYTKGFSNKDYRINDLLQDIKLNKSILIDNKALSLKSALREADYLTLTIGANDILSKMSFKNEETVTSFETKEIINDVTDSLEELIKEIKKYNKGTIMLVGYYNLYSYKDKDIIFEDLNLKTKKLSNKYDLIYIDTYSIITKKYLPNSINIHPNTLGYEVIFNKIKEKIPKTDL